MVTSKWNILSNYAELPAYAEFMHEGRPMVFLKKDFRLLMEIEKLLMNDEDVYPLQVIETMGAPYSSWFSYRVNTLLLQLAVIGAVARHDRFTKSRHWCHLYQKTRHTDKFFHQFHRKLKRQNKGKPNAEPKPEVKQEADDWGVFNLDDL